MLRLLGLVIAGLPCLAWFVDSPWNLAFGLLPPYWPAKAFWVANDHGMWWPYLLGGIVFSATVAWPLLRRFIAKNTSFGVTRNATIRQAQPRSRRSPPEHRLRAT